MDFTNTGFPVCQAGGAGDGAEFWMSSIGVAHKMSQFAMKGNPLCARLVGVDAATGWR
jgi:hypothetical protein